LAIVCAGHALIAGLTCDAYAKGAVAPTITSCFTGFADTDHTIGRRRIIAIAIAQAGHAGDPTSTEGCLPGTAGIISHIAESTGPADTLACARIATVPITQAAKATRPIGRTERCVSIAAGVIARVAELASIIDTLLTITIIVAQAA
jgi:hypothetical protein